MLDRNYQGLARYPMISVILVSLLFLSATTWGAVSDGWYTCLLNFISLAFSALVIIPLILRLPNGSKTFSSYCQQIRLCTIFPLDRNLFIGLSSAMLFLLSLGLASAAIGTLSLDASQITQFQLVDGFAHGVWEEIFFRGVVLVLFLRGLKSRSAALVATSGVFAIIHFNWFHFGRIFLMGFLWGYMTLRSGSILPAMISHTLYNIFSAAFVPDITPDQFYVWISIWTVLVALVILIEIWVVNRTIGERSGKETQPQYP